MLEIFPIPAFDDNYIWLLHNGTDAIVVDPGDAMPVLAALSKAHLTLRSILITHHHSDHIDGVQHLLDYAPNAIAYAPHGKHYTFKHQSVADADNVVFSDFNLNFKVMATPGHTLDHIVYYSESPAILFCGDTLFGAGCGRLFEGTPAQMYNSLQKLAKLPAHTAVYCTHEYTEHNIRFSRMIDPNNQSLIQRQNEAAITRSHHQATLPSSIGLELATNPFLRCNTPSIQIASTLKTDDEIEIFAAIRTMRNHF